jgi:hypothetical protein
MREYVRAKSSEDPMLEVQRYPKNDNNEVFQQHLKPKAFLWLGRAL